MQPPLYLPWAERAAGVWLHPTCLPGMQGIGSLGIETHYFIDFLKASGFKYWQVCPLGPTGYGDSPYQTFSAFAGNPYCIDLQDLQNQGFLHPSEWECLKTLPTHRVDFGRLYPLFYPILKKACQRFFDQQQLPDSWFAFIELHAAWLEPYVAFRALKTHFNGEPWWQWPTPAQQPASASPYLESLQEEMDFWRFCEYMFHTQWQKVRAYAHRQGIQIIGDIPIFVAEDSADVWAFRSIFECDKQGLPISQAGVPPDYFSPLGQLWGNPLYNWDVLKQNGYRWWLQRIQKNLNLFDVIRFDHFRGFAACWRVEKNALDARQGRWIDGPGFHFFQAVQQAYPHARLIAEDLGDITPDVKALLAATGLPGMAILQFAFGGGSKNIYLPHHHMANQVVYPGTHDNDTSLGWYEKAPEATRDHLRRYLRVDGQLVAWDLIRCVLSSPANLALISLQDLLSLGSDARMNTPGQPQGNWQWRYQKHQLEDLAKSSCTYLKQLNELYR